jgi:hypothetical protein
MRFYQHELQFRRIRPIRTKIRGPSRSVNVTTPAVSSNTTQLPRKNQVESIK